jgi:hypothetical protein
MEETSTPEQASGGPNNIKLVKEQTEVRSSHVWFLWVRLG